MSAEHRQRTPPSTPVGGLVGRTTRTTRTTHTTPMTRVTATGRPVAAGGWRRALVGVLVGAVAGTVVLVARRRGSS